jgi:hypothetical protein
MWLCCAPKDKTSRFRTLATPILAQFHSDSTFAFEEGQKYSNISTNQKSEAITFFEANNRFAYEARAIEALRNEAMAQTYLAKLKVISRNIERVQKMWAHNDFMESAEKGAMQMKKIGAVQMDEMHGSEETLSGQEKIEQINAIEEQLMKISREMDEELESVKFDSSFETVDVRKTILEWKLQKGATKEKNNLSLNDLVDSIEEVSKETG